MGVYERVSQNFGILLQTLIFLKLFAYMQIASMSAFGRKLRTAHSSIAHYDVPPPGINLHQGWGVRSVIEIAVVLWLWTGKSLCSVIQWALRIHRSNICGDFTLRYASENNFANLRSGEGFFRIIVIFEACGERPGAVNWMHDKYR